MSKKNNTAAVTVTYVGTDEVKWEFNDAAIERLGSAKGQRQNIGAVYLLLDKAGREQFVAFWGAGVVRRGLMVLAKGRHTSEKDSAEATRLADSLRTVAAAA